MNRSKTRGRLDVTSGLSRDIIGCQLAKAFVLARRAGFRLRVRVLDGNLINDRRDGERIFIVDVFNGIVKKILTS